MDSQPLIPASRGGDTLAIWRRQGKAAGPAASMFSSLIQGDAARKSPGRLPVSKAAGPVSLDRLRGPGPTANAARLDVAKHIAGAAQEYDAMSGRIRSVPFQLVVGDLDFGSDIDM